MRRRLLVTAGVAVAGLGVGGGVWIASGGGDGQADCETVTYTVQDTGSPRMMEYHRVECGGKKNPPGGITGSSG